jgi:outer membrane immunogenic protein
MHRRFLVTATASILLTAGAHAADIQTPVTGYKDTPYAGANWSGFYVGINGGYGQSPYSDQLSGTDPNFGGLSPAGGFGGGQIGYNLQPGLSRHLVVGVEADIQDSGIGAASVLQPWGYTYSSDLTWFGTVRGRAGFVFGPALLYGTGGFAYGGIKNNIDAGGPDFRYVCNKTATGYVAGGGLEYKFAPAWSAKIEYQYLNFGKNDPVRPDGRTWGSFAPFGTIEEDAFHTVRFGLNYHVSPGYEQLK